MRQLGDFASWLGLILIVIGVIYYTPKLVDYMTDDTPVRAAAKTTPRTAEDASARRNMAMYRHPALGLPSPGPASESMSR